MRRSRAAREAFVELLHEVDSFDLSRLRDGPLAEPQGNRSTGKME